MNPLEASSETAIKRMGSTQAQLYSKKTGRRRKGSTKQSLSGLLGMWNETREGKTPELDPGYGSDLNPNKAALVNPGFWFW